MTQHHVPTAGCTSLLASSATCMRPILMCAMSDVRPGWIRTTCETQEWVYLDRPAWGRPAGFGRVTLAVQLVWVILPDVEMVCVKIFPSSGIQGPQMLSDVCKSEHVG